MIEGAYLSLLDWCLETSLAELSQAQMGLVELGLCLTQLRLSLVKIILYQKFIVDFGFELAWTEVWARQ